MSNKNLYFRFSFGAFSLVLLNFVSAFSLVGSKILAFDWLGRPANVTYRAGVTYFRVICIISLRSLFRFGRVLVITLNLSSTCSDILQIFVFSSWLLPKSPKRTKVSPAARRRSIKLPTRLTHHPKRTTSLWLRGRMPRPR